MLRAEISLSWQEGRQTKERHLCPPFSNQTIETVCPKELECPQESRRVEEKADALVPVGGESSSQEAIAHSSPSYQTILQEILESKQ